jgi:hypothetical protein
MPWIKRNLYFLVGGIVAVALLGMAGFYFYSKWSSNQQSLQTLDAAYSEWDGITRLNPNPGNEKIDNIKTAREQRVAVDAAIQKVYKRFTPIPAIPTVEEGSTENFANLFRSSLSRTLDQMQRDAAASGVTLPPRYKFTFQAQSQLFNFCQGCPELLSVHLGNVKAICNILFRAKINSLDNLRRERVGSDDLQGPVADYLDAAEVSVTNELAVLTPYEITFHCFSAELANVLAGFANTPHAFIVKTINVEPAGGASSANLTGMMTMSPEMMSERGMFVPPGMAQPTAPTAPTVRGGLPTVLDEKQIKVTLVVEVVKLLPRK